MQSDQTIVVLALAALCVALAAFWVMRAMVRAGAGRKTRLPLVLGAGVIGLGCLGLYLLLGRPDLPGITAAAQRAAIAERVRTDPDSLSEGELLVHLAQTARANPTDPQPHLFSGMLYLRAGAFAQAQLSYEAALRRDPTLVAGYLGLGRAIVAGEEGDISERAQAMFAEAARLDPSGIEPLFYLAWAAQDRAQPDADARWTALMAAANAAPTPVESLKAMGREAVQARGEISPFALKLFDEIKRRAPNDPLPWFYEALAASSTDSFAEAERLWGEVLARMPADDPRRAMATQMRTDAAARRRPQAPPT